MDLILENYDRTALKAMLYRRPDLYNQHKSMPRLTVEAIRYIRQRFGFALFESNQLVQFLIAQQEKLNA
jgi:hypothetical protein